MAGWQGTKESIKQIPCRIEGTRHSQSIVVVNSHMFLRARNVVTGSLNNQALKFGTNFLSQNREELAHCCRKFPAGRTHKLNRTERGDAPQFQPLQPLLPGSGLPCPPRCYPARKSFLISVAGGTLVVSHPHLIYMPVLL